MQIKTKIPYPSDYDRCVSQAEKELEDDIRPEITTRVKKFATVFFDFGQSAWSVFAEYIAMMGFGFLQGLVLPEAAERQLWDRGLENETGNRNFF